MRLLEVLLLRRVALRRVWGAWQGRRPGQPCDLRQLRRLIARRVLYRRQAEEARNAAGWPVPHRHLNPRRWGVRPTWAVRRAYGAWWRLIPHMRQEDPEMFFNFLRVTPVQFDELLAVVEPAIRPLRYLETTISPGERLAATLRYMAAGDLMVSISYQFLIAPSTLTKVFRRTAKAIWDMLDEALMPITMENWEVCAREFEARWDFPHCFAAADGKHFQVQNFPNEGSDYHNYKGTFSMVLIALVDARLRFRAVDVGGRGRRSDGGLFRRSNFGQRINQGRFELPPPRPLPGSTRPVPYIMVADEAFGLTPNIMTPFPGQFLPDAYNIFNYRLCRARRTSENAFGILTAIFRLFRGPFIASRLTAKYLIMAAVKLHNWLIDWEEDIVPPDQRRYMPPGFADHLQEDGQLVAGEWRNRGPAVPALAPLHEMLGPNSNPEHVREAGEQVRRDFVDFFLGLGARDFQWRHLRHQ